MLTPVDEIKDRLDILEIIGGYIKLNKAGRNYKARCPFHNEKTPSFMVSPERQMWHCFGCGLGGDIFGFVMKIEGLEFGDALRLLAGKAGVVLKKQDPQIQSQKKRLYEISDLAAKFYQTQLEKSISGRQAQKYLLERGLKPATIKQWRLGWAPDNWQALYEFLRSRGYKEQEIEQAGLIIKKSADYSLPTTAKNKFAVVGSRLAVDSYYDRFRSRIMFSLFDVQGQVVGFAGRIFGQEDDNVGKYINTPQTTLYDKSRLLYGLNFAKMELRQKDDCVLVEGNLDVILSHQAGIKNAVATSGTALTEDHLKIIKRYTDNLLFAFDTDSAGENATRRSIDLALAQDFNVKIASLKDKDPADMIKKNSADWQKCLVESESVMDFYLKTTFAKYDSQTADGRRQIRKALLPIIKSLASQTEQSEWLKELAKRLRAEEKDLLADMRKIKLEKTFEPKGVEDLSVKVPQTRLNGLEERLLGLCLIYPHFLPELKSVSEEDFDNQQLASIFAELRNLLKQNQIENLSSQLKKSLPPDLKIQIDYLSLKIEQQPIEEAEAKEEIKSCWQELRLIKLKKQLSDLNFEIQEAQTDKQKVKLNLLLGKFHKLSAELKEY